MAGWGDVVVVGRLKGEGRCPCGPESLATAGISLRVASEVEMPRTRPCRVCRRWFRPHPRAGDRQKVCSAAACQRERHRRNCASWRSGEREPIRRDRVKRAIIKPAEEVSEGCLTPIHERVRWDAVRDSVGLHVAVITEEIVKLIESVPRDAVSPQVFELAEEFHKHGSASVRDPVRRPEPLP